MAERPSNRLPHALIVLTFVTGMVDAVSYLGLGNVFTANMTGNVVLLGFGIAGAPGFTVAAPLVSLAAFVCGAMIGGRIGGRLDDRPHHWLGAALVVEVSFMIASTVVAFGQHSPIEDDWHRFALIAILALAMGARNAAARGLKVPDLTSTVLTMTITGLAVDSTVAGREPQNGANRTFAVLAMLGGAFLGAILVIHQRMEIPLVLITVLVVVTLIGVRRETLDTPL